MNTRPESPSIIHHGAKAGAGNRSNSLNWQLQPSHLSVTYSSSRASASTYPIIWVMSCQEKKKPRLHREVRQDRASTDEESRGLLGRVFWLIWQEKQDNWWVQVDKMSAVLWSRTPTPGPNTNGAWHHFCWGASSAFLTTVWNKKKRKPVIASHAQKQQLLCLDKD